MIVVCIIDGGTQGDKGGGPWTQTGGSVGMAKRGDGDGGGSMAMAMAIAMVGTHTSHLHGSSYCWYT